MKKRLLIVHCAEGAKKALIHMGRLGYTLPGEARAFELSCTGRVGDAFLMESLDQGADGILVLGCRKDNCKFLDGNLRAEMRTNHVSALLRDAGIAHKSVRMLFIAPDEGKRLHDEIQTYIEEIKNLKPATEEVTE